MNDEVHPNKWKIERPYVGLDLDKVKGSIKSIVIHRQVYFPKPLDSATWTLITTDQTTSGEIPLEQAETVIDKYKPGIAQIVLKLYHKEITPNLGIELLPEQYVSISIEFLKRRFRCEIATVGTENANSVFRLLTFGIKMLSVTLPPAHTYLEPYLNMFAEEHAETNRNVLLIIRFQEQGPFPLIISAIKDACVAHGLNLMRADDREYTDDIWGNVMTYMYGCASAIAVFDQINYREFNPNVALEVGFMLAQTKPVLLLKDTAIPALPTDIVGKSYRPFNTYDAANTISPQVKKWIDDYRIGS